MLKDLPVENFTQDWGVNTLGNLHLLQLANPVLAQDAVILHTSSGSVHTAIPGNSSYGVTKMAGAQLFQRWAMENPHHFVMTFHPGFVDTDMSRKARENGLDLQGMKMDDGEFSVPLPRPAFSPFLTNALLFSNSPLHQSKSSTQTS